MENASKALIIAGAILISIVLVSVGVLVVNQLNPDDALNKMSEQEKQVFNQSFESLAGESKSATNVKTLLSNVISNNSQNSDKAISIVMTAGTYTLDTSTGIEAGSDEEANKLSEARSKVNLNKKYDIKAEYKSGIVSKITITQK